MAAVPELKIKEHEKQLSTAWAILNLHFFLKKGAMGGQGGGQLCHS